MLSVLLGLPAVTVRPDESRDRKLQAAWGLSRPDAPALLVRPHSVAELEEKQRAKGATVEYIDDLSAALSTSPVFRARVGASALSKLRPDQRGEQSAASFPSKAECPPPVGWCGVKEKGAESEPSIAPVLKTEGSNHGPKWEAREAGVIKYEIEPRECGGVPGHFCTQKNGDQTGFFPCPAYGGLKNVSKEAAWPHGKCMGPPGPPLDPDALAVEGNTQRCGFSWNDAAAKCGPPCPFALASECDVNAPKLGLNSSFRGSKYTCFKDLPPCDPKKPRGNCYSLVEEARDIMCTNQCNTPNGYCDPTCVCEEAGYGPGAEIENLGNVTKPREMPAKTKALVDEVKLRARTEPGLADCGWKPGAGCDKKHPYECVDTGKCSAENFFEDSACETPCIHESLLPAPPYYALWQVLTRTRTRTPTPTPTLTPTPTRSPTLTRTGTTCSASARPRCARRTRRGARRSTTAPRRRAPSSTPSRAGYSIGSEPARAERVRLRANAQPSGRGAGVERTVLS